MAAVVTDGLALIAVNGLAAASIVVRSNNVLRSATKPPPHWLQIVAT
jgi:hypothetical protein